MFAVYQSLEIAEHMCLMWTGRLATTLHNNTIPLYYTYNKPLQCHVGQGICRATARGHRARYSTCLTQCDVNLVRLHKANNALYHGLTESSQWVIAPLPW